MVLEVKIVAPLSLKDTTLTHNTHQHGFYESLNIKLRVCALILSRMFLELISILQQIYFYETESF